MTRAELAALAKAATPGPWILEPSDDDRPSRYVRTCGYDPKAMESPTSIRCLNEGDSSYIAALSPSVVLRMLAVIEAAVACDADVPEWAINEKILAFRAALSALDAERAP